MHDATDCVRVNPKDAGWITPAMRAIEANKPVEISMELTAFYDIMKAVYERAEENPFKSILEKASSIPGIPPQVSGMLVHVLPVMGTVAALGGPAGAVLGISGVVGYAALHKYDVDTGVDWGKLFNFTDDEAYVRLYPSK